MESGRHQSKRKRLDLVAALLCSSVNTSTQSFSLVSKSVKLLNPSLKLCDCMCGNSRSASILLCSRAHSDRHRRQHSTTCFDRIFHSSKSHTRRDSAIYAKKKVGNYEPVRNDVKKRQPRKSRASSTFSTAVCIVPPDEAWDSIQRARHLARDTSFYKWPPAIRLFHPFAPKSEIPTHVGKLSEWIDEEGLRFELSPESGEILPFLSPFEVTLDSLQILPHWEILDAQTDADENQVPQQGLGESLEEKRFRKQKEESKLLIEQEAKKGVTRKKERERKDLIGRRRTLKRELKQCVKEIEMGLDHADIDEIKNELQKVQDEIDRVSALGSTEREKKNLIDRRRALKRELKQCKKEIEMGVDHADIDVIKNELQKVQDEIDRVSALELTVDRHVEKEEVQNTVKTKSNTYDGPCVIYLSPNEQSCIALKELREELRKNLFHDYDAFSTSSSVSPYPEFLPMKSLSSEREGWKPLLPIARFPSVKEAVQMAKVLQKSWHPLEFNVTDIQFISRDDDFVYHNNANFDPGSGFGTSKNTRTKRSISLTTSGEVEDVSKQGVFGCDAMVMLLGEEPIEEFIEDGASLSMIVPEDESESSVINGNSLEESPVVQGTIDYNSIFINAEREYQRMKSHEELFTAEFVGQVPIFSGDDDLEKWLDVDEEADEGATAVLGRAQFFMGAMREFVGMPVSSVLDNKERVMGGGVNSAGRKKGSRNINTWDSEDGSSSSNEEHDVAS